MNFWNQFICEALIFTLIIIIVSLFIMFFINYNLCIVQILKIYKYLLALFLCKCPLVMLVQLNSHIPNFPTDKERRAAIIKLANDRHKSAVVFSYLDILNSMRTDKKHICSRHTSPTKFKSHRMLSYIYTLSIVLIYFSYLME